MNRSEEGLYMRTMSAPGEGSYGSSFFLRSIRVRRKWSIFPYIRPLLSVFRFALQRILLYNRSDISWIPHFPHRFNYTKSSPVKTTHTARYIENILNQFDMKCQAMRRNEYLFNAFVKCRIYKHVSLFRFYLPKRQNFYYCNLSSIIRAIINMNIQLLQLFFTVLLSIRIFPFMHTYIFIKDEFGSVILVMITWLVKIELF